MLSFELSEDQQMLRETCRKFAAEELRGKAREHERARGVPDELRRRFHDLGLALVDVPEAAGGLGLGTLTAAVAHEELAYGDPGSAVALWSPGGVPAALLELGTPEQAARWLPRFGEPDAWKLRGALAWSEPGTKGPEAGFATTARKDGDGWVLDGEKAHVLHAGEAGLFVVFAQVDAAAGWGGIAGFVVEAGAAGLAAGEREAWLGLETASAGRLKLSGVRVGDDARLGGGGDPGAAATRMFARLAITAAARQVGVARAAFDYALAYTQERTAFGKAVAHFQSVSFDLADMATDVECARWMVWRAAVEFDRGAKGAVASALAASAHANQLAWRVADDGVQLLGGAGFVQDNPSEKWMRDTKALALTAPPDQLASLALGARAAGQPDVFGAALPSPWLQPVVT